MSGPVEDEVGPTTSGRAAATRENLLRSAGEQFAIAGYQAASLGKILLGAGVTKGALYFHFDSKRALADAVIVESISRRARCMADAGSEQVDPLRALVARVRTAVQMSLSDPVVRGGERLLDDPLTDTTHAVRHYLIGEAMVHDALRAADDRGLLRPGVSRRVVARALDTMISGHRLICSRTGTVEELPGRIDEMWRAMMPLIAVESWLRDNPELVGSARSGYHRPR